MGITGVLLQDRNDATMAVTMPDPHRHTLGERLTDPASFRLVRD